MPIMRSITTEQVQELRNRKNISLLEAKRQLTEQNILDAIERYHKISKDGYLVEILEAMMQLIKHGRSY